MPIQNRNYYGAVQTGREDALQQQAMQQRNALGRMEVDRGQRFNALANDPNATAEQYARQTGRTDVSNYMVGRENAAAAAKQKKAKQLLQAAQYGLSNPAPKRFIEQNYPQLAQMYGPDWATATDEDVKRGLQDAIGIFGPQAGEGPPQARGVGAMYKYINDQGKAVYGSAEEVSGRSVYESQQERAPPSGYQWKNGQLAPIPGGPADPLTNTTKDDTRRFAKADKLRDEFNAQSKDFISVGDNFNNVRAAAQDPSAAGDISMIFAYMKMLDPNSVVRETEYATAQNAAGIPDRVQNLWNRALDGERLNPAQRADFIAQAKKVYEVRKKRNEGVVKRYSEMAKRNGVDPQDVIGDFSVIEEEFKQTEGWSIKPVGQ
jgi:hypothetical protein